MEGEGEGEGWGWGQGQGWVRAEGLGLGLDAAPPYVCSMVAVVVGHVPVARFELAEEGAQG